jgi:hypothetical protein
VVPSFADTYRARKKKGWAKEKRKGRKGREGRKEGRKKDRPI